MKILLLSLVTGLLFLTSTCDKTSDEHMEVKGIIEQQGMTSYQYGTHTITARDTFYALRSTKVDLDEYNGKEVKIYGNKIEGYPIDGGPEFLEVKKIKNQD